jgi:hypothetical protein
MARMSMRAERARVARAFVGGVLGPGQQRGDDAASGPWTLLRVYARCVAGMKDVWIAGMDATLRPGGNG